MSWGELKREALALIVYGSIGTFFGIVIGIAIRWTHAH